MTLVEESLIGLLPNYVCTFILRTDSTHALLSKDCLHLYVYEQKKKRKILVFLPPLLGTTCKLNSNCQFVSLNSSYNPDSNWSDYIHSYLNMPWNGHAILYAWKTHDTSLKIMCKTFSLQTTCRNVSLLCHGQQAVLQLFCRHVRKTGSQKSTCVTPLLLIKVWNFHSTETLVSEKTWDGHLSKDNEQCEMFLVSFAFY